MKKPFQIGEQVQCSYLPIGYGSPQSARAVVRTVTHVERISESMYAAGSVTTSGWLVSADGGKPCPHCGAAVPPIPLIDSGYYTAVVSEKGADR